jgi:hypothetical protein
VFNCKSVSFLRYAALQAENIDCSLELQETMHQIFENSFRPVGFSINYKLCFQFVEVVEVLFILRNILFSSI